MKKIRKTYSGVVPNGKVLNSRNDSLQDTYSSDYLNRTIPNTNDLGKIVVDDIKCKNDFPLLNNFNSAGISITSNSDGTYNITGTATANIECVLFKNIEDTIIENGKAYTLSTNQTLPTGVNSRIEFYNNVSYVRGFLTVINTASNNPTAVANTTNVNKVRFGLFVTSGTTINITNLGLQLEKGPVATDYVEHKEFSNKQIYSTNEQVIGTWLGKPLYRKIIDCGALPNNSTKNVPHNITNIDFMKAPVIFGRVASNNTTISYPYYDNNTPANSVNAYVNNTNVILQTKNDRSAYNGYAILEYTKTTD